LVDYYAENKSSQGVGVTDTVIEKKERIKNFSFQVIHDAPENSNVFIVFLDPQFNIVWIERPLLDLLGETLSHFSGKQIFEFITGEEIIALLLGPENIDDSFMISEFLFCTSPYKRIVLRNCSLRIKLYQNDRGMINGYFLIISQSESLGLN
jgi:hypothetical protein